MAGLREVISNLRDKFTNYEVSKKEVYTIDPLIKVKRLSIGVLVDANIKNLDMEKIKRIVVASAGINQQRGDTITVAAIPFQRPVPEKPAPDYEKYIKGRRWRFLKGAW